MCNSAPGLGPQLWVTHGRNKIPAATEAEEGRYSSPVDRSGCWDTGCGNHGPLFTSWTRSFFFFQVPDGEKYY